MASPARIEWSKLPFLAVSGVVEMVLSRRGFAPGFLLLAALLIRGAWIRPPLSPDIRALQVPLAMTPLPAGSAESMLVAPRDFRFDSVGAVLLIIIEIGVVVMVFRPQWLKLFAGLLLATSVVGSAVCALNHPELVELMDSELVQRLQIAGILRDRSEMSMAGNSPPRTEVIVMPRQDNSPLIEAVPPTSIYRGWNYRVYGTWLLFAAAFVILLETRGRWERRCGHVALWIVAGLVIAGFTCSRRLQAEYYWQQAELAEHAGDLEAARRAVDESVAIFPEFSRLMRTWTLVGKMDYRQQRSLYCTFYRVSQLAYHQDRVLALGMLTQLTNQDTETALPAPIRNLAAQLLTDLGRKYLAEDSLVSARDCYVRASRFCPFRVDSVLGYGIVLAKNDHKQPELVEAQFKPLIARVGDRALRADLMERIGNAFFEAGQMVEARKYYQDSLDTFCQPKYINLPAQEGMVGM